MREQTQPQPTAEQQSSTRLYLRMLLLLVLATLLAHALPLPWKVASPVLGIAAAVVAIIGLTRALRMKASGNLRAIFVVGLVTSLFLMVISLAQVAFWPMTAEYEQCVRSALTRSAQERCMVEYQQHLQDLSNVLRP
ncbi:hypothetical protein LVY72_02055 [Arthrobacter sp. I2-34]|uniref:Uncharacterized protein n=1 Tax=Arthrobacter hankyongi TaxID=2904801 RepID=A0ABS9L264_9MICC|nr:hypothetical protein [Arthrobacter hankyongi]MCG2620690.1 hypothetical protein [Arthrobacter hankyongi]